MKKLLLILALFVGVITIAEAQRGTDQRPSQGESAQHRQRMDPKERIEKQTARLKEQLTLTDEQTAKVKEIMTKNMEAQHAAFEKARENNEQPDREKMRAQMQASMDKQNNEIKAVLTAGQKTKYEQLIKEREERMKNRQQQGPPQED